jgi:predicted kinase
MTDNANLIIIRGLPGSGKSTLAWTIAGQIVDSAVYEADQFFIDHVGEYKFDRNLLREAHAWCQDQTKRQLALGRTAIVSNTFTTIKELRPYFDIAREFSLTPTVILTQNNWGSVHGVPEETMIAMRQRFVYEISPLFANN